jgi:alpha-L-rhamnosidase
MVDDLVDWGIPDWVPADPASRPKGEYTSSLFFRAALEIAAKIAGFKGLADDARRFTAQADRTRAAIRARYGHGDGLFENGSQTAQAMALQFGLAEPGERPAAERRLVEAVHAADDHVTCGIYGMTYLFRALSEAGRTDLAFRVLTRDSDPSPARWIAQGATTLWEDFKDGQSRNHIMFGDFAAWAFAHLAGIRPLESAPGGREMLIAPCPIAALEFAEATVGTPYGTYASAWRREGGMLSFTVTVPPNASAIVRLPGREEQRLGPGTHTLCE